MPCLSSQHKSTISNQSVEYLQFLYSNSMRQVFPPEVILHFCSQGLIDDFCGRFTYLQLSDSANYILVVSDHLNILLAAQRGTFVLSNNGLLTALTERGISIAGLSLHFALDMPTGYQPSVGQRKPMTPVFLPVRAKQATKYRNLLASMPNARKPQVHLAK